MFVWSDLGFKFREREKQLSQIRYVISEIGFNAPSSLGSRTISGLAVF